MAGIKPNRIQTYQTDKVNKVVRLPKTITTDTGATIVLTSWLPRVVMGEAVTVTLTGYLIETEQ